MLAKVSHHFFGYYQFLTAPVTLTVALITRDPSGSNRPITASVILIKSGLPVVQEAVRLLLIHPIHAGNERLSVLSVVSNNLFGRLLGECLCL